MKTKKSYLIIAGFLGISLLIILLGIIYAFFNPQADKQQPSPVPTQADVPIPTPEEQASPAINYDPDDEERLLDIVETRPSLSEEDLAAKARILTLLPQGEVSGYVHTSSNVNIEYVNNAESFLVEILIPNLELAKAEANTWFLEQGMTQDGICKLPAVFYVNFDIAEELRGTDTTFSTLAPGC